MKEIKWTIAFVLITTLLAASTFAKDQLRPYILKKFEPGVRAYLEQKGSHAKHGNQRRVNDAMEVPRLKLAASSVF